MFLQPRNLARNLALWVRRLVSQFAFNHFIFRRGAGRGIAHMLIMWGCILAAAVTFPLVFGWIHFETPRTTSRITAFSSSDSQWGSWRLTAGLQRSPFTRSFGPPSWFCRA
ncbi:MAG: hypothetical protein R2748_22045 [Bryobacterales bacterium]